MTASFSTPNVLAAAERLEERRILRVVREDAELDLRVVGGEDPRARRRHERRADAARELRADGDVLEVRVGRGEAAGRRAGLVERRVDAAVRADELGERVDVGPLELRERAVLEDERGERVVLGELLEDVLVRGRPRLEPLQHGQPELLGAARDVSYFPRRAVYFTTRMLTP